MTRLVIAGGGTGGHLFPGVAIAEELLAREPTAEVLFVGTARGIEARVVPKLGMKLALIEASGLKTVGALGALRGLLKVPRALWQSRKILRNFKPDAVIGVGGYASGPVVLAAWLRRIPTAILEQNSIPGLANKILGRIVRRVFLAFEETRKYFKPTRIVMSGNPIRKAMRERLVAGSATTAGAGDATGMNVHSASSRPRSTPTKPATGSEGTTATDGMSVHSAQSDSTAMATEAAGGGAKAGIDGMNVHFAQSDSRAMATEAVTGGGAKAGIDGMNVHFAQSDSRAMATEAVTGGGAKAGIDEMNVHSAQSDSRAMATEAVAGGGAKAGIDGMNVHSAASTTPPTPPTPPPPFPLLCFGGSLGARAVNTVMVDAAIELAKSDHPVHLALVHQTGPDDKDAISTRYRDAQLPAPTSVDVRDFIDDMAAEYFRARLVVARAGATTIAELGVVGRAAILVPYPFAADDHQHKNAQALVDAGAALVFRQADLDGKKLATAIRSLVEDPDRLERMQSAMRSLGRPGAAATIVDWLTQR